MSTVAVARRPGVLDVVFLIGVVLKGLDGLVELILGAPLLVLRPDQLQGLARAVTADELSEDPHDLVAHLLLHSAAAATTGTVLFAGVCLLIHGAVKLAVVAALIVGARRIHPWAIGVLTAFVIFQLLEMTVHPSVGLVLLTVLDVVVIALTWREWRQHRTFRDTWLSVRRRLPHRV